MLKRYYTLIVFNEIMEKPINIRISKTLFKYSVLIGFIFSIIFVGYSSYYIHLYSIASKEAKDAISLRTESKEQKLQIQKFIKKINGFEKDIRRIEKLDKKLRLISAIDGMQEAELNKLRIGGSPEIDIDETNIVFNQNTINKMTSKIERLKNQADLQEVSLYQLDKFFKDRRSFLKSIPSIWPVKGWITSGFGYRLSPYTDIREIHDGVDIAAPLHSNIISPADGFVIRSGRKHILGVMIEIDHGYGFVTRYAHNSINLAQMGDRVKRGQIIAKVGNTGRSTGPHLHYGIFLNGIPVNPMKYIME